MALVIDTGGVAARGGLVWRAAAWRAVVLWGCALVLAGASVAVLAAAPWSALAAHVASRDWPEAQATVTSVGLRDLPGADGEPRLALVVSYAFEIDGVAHEGRRASLADEAGADDRRLKALYTRLNFARVTGAAVPVIHHPGEPGLALIDRDLAWWPLAARLAAALALMAGALAAAASAAGRLRRRASLVRTAS